MELHITAATVAHKGWKNVFGISTKLSDSIFYVGSNAFKFSNGLSFTINY